MRHKEEVKTFLHRRFSQSRQALPDNRRATTN